MAVAGGDAGGESGKGRTDEVSLGLGTVGEPHRCQLLAPPGPPRRSAFTSRVAITKCHTLRGLHSRRGHSHSLEPDVQGQGVGRAGSS